MAMSSLDLGLLLGFCGGVGTFFRGFRAYRKYLLLQGTSEMPIRSIAMGLVRIHGKVTRDHLVDSPISHTPCGFYQVHIEKWKDEGESGKWLHYGAEANGVSFYLEDSSGRVLVDPRGAEYDLESTCVREAPSSSSFPPRGASDAELLSYVARVGPSAEAPGSRHNLEAEQMMFAMSKYAKKGTTPDEMMRKLFPQVMQGEAKMIQGLEAEGPLSDPLREEIRLAQIELYKHPFWSPEYAEGFQRVTKLQAQHKKESPFTTKISLPVPPPPPTDEVEASVAGFPSASGRYRLTERCILPDHEYDITGTCTENPGAKDENDRNLIRKGRNEPTYLISGLAGPDVNAMQRMRAQLMIVGGGMLAVFCMGLLLLNLRLF